MPKRYLSRLVRGCVLGGGIFLLAAEPAPAQPPQLYVTRVGRPFAGGPATAMIFGSIHDVVVHRVVKPMVVGERIVLELQTLAVLGRRDPFAYRIDIPRLAGDGSATLVVEGVDIATGTGLRTEYLNEVYSFGEPGVQLAIDRHVLLASETFTASAIFDAASGGFPGTWELAGDRVRIPLDIGCIYCAIPTPLEHFELVSPPIGPLPPGEYTVELWDSVDEQEIVYLAEKIKVLPDQPALQDGRFTVEVALDPPHGGQARLVDAPSRDSALFYFFSPDNWELMVKVLDGCALNGNFWVFGAASTDVGYTVVVRDALRAEAREYRHPAGTPAPAITDSAAFPCGPADQGDAR